MDIPKGLGAKHLLDEILAGDIEFSDALVAAGASSDGVNEGLIVDGQV